MVPLSDLFPSANDRGTPPEPDAQSVLEPLQDASPVMLYAAPGYEEYVLLSVVFRAVRFILDLVARVIYLSFGWILRAAKSLRLRGILRRYPRSLYCAHCHSIQRRY